MQPRPPSTVRRAPHRARRRAEARLAPRGPAGWPGRAGGAGFTLIELILVMSLLVIAVGVTFPSLQDFFRGRGLDSEARRFLSMIHYGQTRAVSEGIPMVLWLDPKEGSYGLQAEAGYLEEDTKAVEFEMDRDVEMTVSAASVNAGGLASGGASGGTVSSLSQRARTSPLGGRSNLAAVRFSPDGSLVETCPEYIQFQQTRTTQRSSLWVAQAPNRLSYEIRDTEPTLARR